VSVKSQVKSSQVKYFQVKSTMLKRTETQSCIRLTTKLGGMPIKIKLIKKNNKNNNTAATDN
jgi:hypothetical protein